MIVTELAVITVTPGGFRLDEIAAGLTVADVQAARKRGPFPVQYSQPIY